MMKIIIAVVLAIVLCLGLCACDAGAVLEEMLTEEPEEIILPTVPQIQVPAPISQNDAETEDGTEAIDPAEETYPWETEFNEEGYEYHEEKFSHGKIISWHKNFIPARQITYWNDGRVYDNYFYPNGNLSHGYQWEADGLYVEFRYLDNGYIETKEDGAIISHTGTNIYQKFVNSDGYWGETHFDENEIPVKTISGGADGSYEEVCYFENGDISRHTHDSPNGEHYEYEYYENGCEKYSKHQSPEYTTEQRFDEEGFCTYFYYKDTAADYEIELISDESGKLVKAVENGSVIEDAAALAQHAKNYNFRQ